MRYDIPPDAGRILRVLAGAGFEANLVGGCVRDLLRGVPPHDWDICTSARPEEVERCFAGQKVLRTGLKHGTLTVLDGGEGYEITTYRREGPYSDGRRPDYVRFVSGLHEDLARRDFTINAMAIDAGGRLHDPFGGREDLSRRSLRCVGQSEQRFREDGLRLMRALRFASVLEFGIEAETARAIHENAAMLDRVAAERIRAELWGMLVGRGAGDVLREYPDVLCRFWPELGPLVTLEQNNPWHCWGGWEHTVRTVEAVPAQVTLRLAMLLHDVGKPECRSTDAAGIDHFFGHAAAGARLAGEMLRRLKADGATCRRVVTLVEHHDLQIPLRDRVIRRWLGRLGEETFFQLLEVKRADSMGQPPEKTAGRRRELEETARRAEEMIARGECFSLRDLAVDGRDVLAAGVPPGPEVGRVLDGLLERVVDGRLPNERPVLLELLAQNSDQLSAFRREKTE